MFRRNIFPQTLGWLNMVQIGASVSKLAPLIPRYKPCTLPDVTIQKVTVSGTSSIRHSFIFCISLAPWTEQTATTRQTTAVWNIGWQNARKFLLQMALPTNRSTRKAFLSLKANVHWLKITYKIVKTTLCLVPVCYWFKSMTGSNKLLVPGGSWFQNITGRKSLLDSILDWFQDVTGSNVLRVRVS
jgi:hypothetical protein